jgi:hypothetical protein
LTAIQGSLFSNSQEHNWSFNKDHSFGGLGPAQDRFRAELFHHNVMSQDDFLAPYKSTKPDVHVSEADASG